MTGIVGSLAEAWAEVRVHRSRVVLSLVGVVLAVFAMTVVTAAGTLGGQLIREDGERTGGRDTTVVAYAHGSAGPQQQADTLRDLADRYSVEHSSLVGDFGTHLAVPGRPATGPDEPGTWVSGLLVEPEYGVIHRIVPGTGRWFLPEDGDRLAPAAVVNERFVKDAGLEGAVPPFTAQLATTPVSTVTVIGVMNRNPWGPEMILLTDAADVLPGQLTQQASWRIAMWVPSHLAQQIHDEVPAVLQARGLDGDAYVSSMESLDGIITAVQWAMRVLSWFALGLGTLGVLNVGIVTVRQRVREIGVRRALGASSGRVFAAVVLESVCATAVAGLIGVALAVAVVRNAPLHLLLGELGVTDTPPFPVGAAVEGFVTAVVVGALAGLVPATMAVRAKVIDAIRY